MAVYAAHLTRTLQGTPSVFQVTAQEALGATVKPAFRKLFEYLAAVYPNKFGWSLEWFDELYLLFDCCLQYHYLKHYAASFSESFYGLLRVPLSGKSEFSDGPRLPPSLETASLALLVLAPYLRDKLEARVGAWREDAEDGRLGTQSKLDRTKRAAITVYTVMHVVCSASKFAQMALYVAGGASAHSPSLAALGLALRPAPPAQDKDYSWGELAKSLFTGHVGMMVPALGALVLRGVEYGAFGVQLLRWWEAQAPDAQALAPPPPPRRCTKHSNKCPVCLRTWRIPTVLPVSGYVFCYVCVSRHVRAHGACPVSRCPASERQLVRLYVG